MPIAPARRRRGTWALAIGLLAVFGAAALAVLGRHDVSGDGRRALAAWSSVETEFRQRAALVPPIIAALRKVDRSQEGLIQRVEAAQAAVLALEPDSAAPFGSERFRTFMATQDRLSRALGEVLDILHQYPARSERYVQDVLGRLEDSESRIVIARADYVNAARRYNEGLSSLTGRLLAAVVGPRASPMVASFDAVNG